MHQAEPWYTAIALTLPGLNTLDCGPHQHDYAIHAVEADGLKAANSTWNSTCRRDLLTRGMIFGAAKRPAWLVAKVAEITDDLAGTYSRDAVRRGAL